MRITKIQYTEIETTKGRHGVLVTLTTQGEVSIWNMAPVHEALNTLEKGSNMKIENNEDLLIATINLNCRCSSLAVQ